jgi:hypothetical protein
MTIEEITTLESLLQSTREKIDRSVPRLDDPYPERILCISVTARMFESPDYPGSLTYDVTLSTDGLTVTEIETPKGWERR